MGDEASGDQPSVSPLSVMSLMFDVPCSSTRIDIDTTFVQQPPEPEGGGEHQVFVSIVTVIGSLSNGTISGNYTFTVVDGDGEQLFTGPARLPAPLSRPLARRLAAA